MRGPIEYIIDREHAKEGRPTFAEELAGYDERETLQMKKVAKLLTFSGLFMSAITVSYLATPVTVELDKPDNFFARETIESAITTVLQAPIVASSALSLALTAEALNFWRRTNNHQNELQANPVE